MSELTREQVEAMDETMTFNTHRVTQMHRRNELEQHFFAPGVIQGPSDCQAHHDWEDSQRMAGEGWGRISLQIKALIVLVIVLAGIAVGVKDIFDTRDLATGYGSPIYPPRPALADAAVVAVLRRAGGLAVHAGRAPCQRPRFLRRRRRGGAAVPRVRRCRLSGVRRAQP